MWYLVSDKDYLSGKEKENKEKIRMFSPGVLFVHGCGLNTKFFFSKLLLASDLNKYLKTSTQAIKSFFS